MRWFTVYICNVYNVSYMYIANECKNSPSMYLCTHFFPIYSLIISLILLAVCLFFIKPGAKGQHEIGFLGLPCP